MEEHIAFLRLMQYPEWCIPRTAEFAKFQQDKIERNIIK